MDWKKIRSKIKSGTITQKDIEAHIELCELELINLGYSEEDISELRESIEILIASPIQKIYEHTKI